MSENLSTLFLRFRDHNDMRALARVFDRTAPELASVAAHLARSAADAEDLVQATFLAAIESAASYDASRPLVPWLIGILSMQAHKQRERSSREMDPERVHQPGPADPASAVQAREITSAVDAAVGKLDGRYAGLVRRHLLEGAPPAQLAREFELSSVTTRVRLHRGLKQLRKLLPAGMAGTAFGAALWRLDLAAIRGRVLRRAAELSGASVPVASLASAGLLIALLVPIAVATPAWLLWRSRTTSEVNSALEMVAASNVVEPEVSSGSAGAASASEAFVVVEPKREPAASSAPAQSNAPAHQAIVRGRFLRADGTPASGASLDLDGFQGSSSQAQDNGEPVEWTKPPVSTNSADGSFELVFDAPAGFRFTLRVDAPGCARAAWGWFDLQAGMTRDLGEVRLEAAGSLLARIVNEQGEPLFVGWSMIARMEPPDQVLGRTGAFVKSAGDAQTSNFRLDSLAPRLVGLSATHACGASSEKLSVQVVAGQITPVELVYRGPELGRRITVQVNSSQKTPFMLQPEHVWIEPSGSAPLAAVLNPQSIGTYSVDGLAPGHYRVRIVDPRIVEWTKDGVQPGEMVKASVKGNAALRLTILEADQTHYTGRYRLSVRRFGNSTPGGIQPLVAANVDPPANGLVAEIWPGTYSLELLIPGRTPKQFGVANLQALETRDVLVTFGATSAIHGRVLANDGTTPMANVDVQLTGGALAGHTLGKQASVLSTDGEVPPVYARTKTDAGGNFQFPGLQPGTWTLRASWSRWLASDRTLSLPDSGALEIIQPASGFFAGRLLLPETVPLEDTLLEVEVIEASNHTFTLRTAPEPGELHPDGSFRLGPIPAGAISAGIQVFSGISGEFGSGQRMGSGPRLGTFQVSAGEPTPVEIDLRSIFPARMHGSVHIDGNPAAAGRLCASPLENTANTAANFTTNFRAGESSVTFEGRYSMGGFAPGRELVLEYTSPQGWSWTSPQRVTLAPAADQTVDLAFDTIEREIQIVDATTHLPVANQRIAWRTGQGSAITAEELDSLTGATSKSDAQGKLQVRMPAGTVRPIALPNGPLTTSNTPSGTFAPATIDWSSGSATIVLQLAQQD